tara:strand:- start:111 stop:884 length:774 start_codon:yes stop_codon:yes gene_type:complete
LTGSKYIRAFANPNKRLQDLEKMYLLSAQAESRFSIYEKWFAENIFKKFQIDGEKNLNYNDKLFYFIISVLWRILRREIHFHDYKNKPFFENIKSVENEWKLFLSDYIFPRNFSKIGIFLTDRVQYHDFNISGVDYYFSRSIDSTIVSNEDGSYCFVYAKFLKFILFGFIKGGDEKLLKPTLINPIKGGISFPQDLRDEEFYKYFIYRIMEINNLPSPSQNQQEAIDSQFKKEFNELKNKEVWEIILNDWTLLDPPK